MKTFLQISVVVFLLIYSAGRSSAQNLAVNLDGVDDYMSIPITGSPQFTIEAWVNFSGSTVNRNIIVFTNGNPLFSATNQIRTNSSGKFSVYAYDGNARNISGTTTIIPNTWYHVAITASNNNSINLYVNGTLEGSVNVNTLDLESQYQIGSFTYGNAQNFEGTIDELRIWNVQRTQAEINSNKNCPLSATEFGLVCYINFNNSSAVSGGNNTGLNIASDSALSNGSNNATLNNFSLTGATSNWVNGNSEFNITTGFLDADGDGYGDPLVVTNFTCNNMPANSVLNNLDCNDANSSVFPGQTEIPDNNIDDNCNGSIDETVAGNYRSFQSGNWSSVSSWQKFDGANWITASVFPTASDGVISIRSGHTITQNLPDPEIDQLVILSGGTLLVANCTGLGNGPGDDMQIFGTYTINNGCGGLSCSSANGCGVYRIKSGGVLNINTAASLYSVIVNDVGGIVNISGALHLAGFVINRGTLNINQPINMAGDYSCLRNYGSITGTSSITNNSTGLNNGHSINEGTISLSGSYIFSGTVAQQLNGTGTASLNTLLISNPTGVTLGGSQNFTISNQLRLDTGKVFLGNSNLIVTNPAFNGVDAFDGCCYTSNNFIVTNGTGSLTRTVPAGSGNFWFPVSGISGDNMSGLDNTSGPTEVFSARVSEQLSSDYNSSNQPSGLSISNHAVNRTWVIKENTPGGNTATILFTWGAVAELPSFTNSNVSVFSYDGSNWQSGPFINGSTRTITKTGVTSFREFTVADNLAFNTYYQDLDNDGYGNLLVSIQAPSPPPGYILTGGDCNDNDASVHPGGGIICATAGENGAATLTAPNGQLITGITFASYGLPNGTCGNFTIGSCHAASSMSVVQSLALNHNSVSIGANNGVFGDPCVGTGKRLYIQATYGTQEICNGLDDDCDGSIDEGFGLMSTYYRDFDGDGYGNPADDSITCSGQPTGYILNNTDCDDTNAGIHPGLPSGLKLWLPFNGDANDYSGLNHHATFNNATLTTGHTNAVNTAYQFNGSNSRIEVADNPDLRPTNFTLSSWIYYTSVPGGLVHLVAKPLCGGFGDSYAMWFNGGALRFGWSSTVNSIEEHAFTPPAVNQWHHIAMTFDDVNNVAKVYIDNVLQGTFNTTISPIYDATPFIIGAEYENCNLGFWLTGKIDETILFNRALTAAEITAVYNGAGFANEICNGIDDNCDGVVDNGVTITYYRDSDNDSFGDPLNDSLSCNGQPSGYVSNNLDCNDSNNAINPDATEICNNIDDNCDGQIDNFNSVISGLVGEWLFNGNLTDITANSNNGTAFNGVGYSTGVDGNSTGALIFDGVDDYVEMNSINAYSFGVGDFSYSYWFNTSNVTTDMVMVTKSPNGSGVFPWLGFFSSLAGGGVHGRTQFNSTASYMSNLRDAQWHHYGFTRTGNLLSLYIDGILRTTITFPIDNCTTNDKLVLGRNGNGFFNMFTGKLDNLRIYNRSLSSTEINSLYNFDHSTFQTYYLDNDQDGYGNSSIDSISCSPPQGYVVYNNDCNDNNASIHPGLSTGLKLFLPFTGNANDVSGLNHSGTVFNATLTTDRFGNPNQAYDFNGINSRIEIADHSDFHTGNLSMGGWFNIQSPTGQQYQSFFGKSFGNSFFNSYTMGYDNNNQLIGVAWSDGNSSPIYFQPYPLTGQWFHYAFTFNDATNEIKLYINGNLFSSTTTNLSLGFDGRPIIIGCESENNSLQYFAKGKMDELFIYNRVLSPLEISNIFQSISAGAEICNGIDDDCDGIIDNGFSSFYYADADNDGFGNSEIDTICCSCGVIPGYVHDSTDCDDTNGASHPGAVEVLNNNIDEDCSGSDAKQASALNFDGIKDEIISSNSAHYFEPAAFTFECWVKRNNSSPVSGKDRLMVSQNINGWGIGFNPDGKLFLSHVGVSGVASTTSILNTSWHHVAVTHDGTTAKFYIDGNVAGSFNYPVVFSSTGNYSIGNRQGLNEFLSGSMDEVRVWNVVRTQAQIQANMNCELQSGIPRLIANYHFNQGIAFENNVTITSLVDSSGFAHNGSLSNFTLNGNISNWITPGAVLTGSGCTPCIPSQEICNGLDDDCDGLTDDADPDITGQPVWYADVDGDGFGNPSVHALACSQPSGYISDNTDCDDSNSTIHPGGVPGVISGSTIICINTTQQFISSGNANGVWSSGNNLVATINSSGLVNAITTGTTVITYTVSGCNVTSSTSSTITVRPNVSAGVVSGSVSICNGSSSIFTSSGTAGGIWSSDNSAIASVGSLNGFVSALTTGTAIITYSVAGCGGTSSSAKSVITSNAVASGIITGASLLCLNESSAFSSNGTSGGTWSSSNNSIASVDLIGNVTALSSGVAIITYAVSGCNGSFTSNKSLLVISSASAGTISGSSLMCVNTSATFGTNGTPSGSWSSSDNAVAAINSSTGALNALSNGTSTITYTVTACSGTFASTFSLSVGTPVDAGVISGSTQLCVNDISTMSTTGTPGGTWSSSDPSKVTVNNSSGQVSAISGGAVTITYTVSGCNGNKSSTRQINIISLASAGTIIAPAVMCIGTSSSFNTNGTSGGSWNSGNPSVATVNSQTGEVTTISAGSAVINYSVIGCGGIFMSSHTLNVSGNLPVLTFSDNSDFTSSIVFPLEGEQSDNYRFEISYVNQDGILPAPGFPRMMLDFEGDGSFAGANDKNLILTPANPADQNVVDGKIYYVVLHTLPLGKKYEAIFVAKSAGGCEVQSVRYPGPDITTPPNLSIFADDIVFSDSHPVLSDTITVFATVHNDEPVDLQNIAVHLINQYDLNITYPEIVIPNMLGGTSTTVSWQIITPPTPSWNPMQVVVDYQNGIEEINELDNQAIRPFINGNFNLPGTINVSATNSQTVCQGGLVTICGRAIYQGTAVPLQDPSVAGATVTLIVDETRQEISSFSNSQGNYCISFAAPSGLGTFHVSISTTDFTLTGEQTATFTVVSCPPPPPMPDIRSEIVLDAYEVFTGMPVTAHVVITNIGSLPVGPTTSEIRFGATGVSQNFATPALAPGASYTSPAFTYTSPIATGDDVFYAQADASNLIIESNENNNASAAGFHICQFLPDLTCGFHTLYGYPVQTYMCTGLSFGVTNNLCVPINTPFDVQFQIYLGGNLVNSLTRTIQPLLRGQGVGVSFNNTTLFPGPGNYTIRMEVDVNNVIQEFVETNNIYTGTFNVYECKPELGAGSFCSPVMPADPAIPGNITVYGTVSNSGLATAYAPFIVDFEVAGAHFPITIINDLPQGASIGISQTFPTPAYGCPFVTIITDATNVVDEYNEQNVTTIPLLWDFTLDRICYHPILDEDIPNPNFWEVPHNVGEPVELGIGVWSYSTYTAAIMHTRFEVRGPQITSWLDLGYASIVSLGQSCGECPNKLFLTNSFAFPDTGIYEVRITADYDDRYVECDELNNDTILEVHITSYPDYRTLSKYIAPSLLNPEVGEGVTIDVTFANVGTNGIDDSLDVLVKVDNSAHEFVRVKGLLSGTTFTAHCSNQWASLLPGVHVIRAIVDARDEVLEGNESNNQATRAIVVGKASNLYFQVFEPDIPFPTIGQQINLNTRLGNGGDLDCEGDIEYFYLNDQLDTIPVGTIHVLVKGRDSTTVIFPWIVVDNTTTLIAKITNTTKQQIRDDDKIATTRIDDFGINLSTTPGCFGGQDGSIKANASGGLPPLTITWSNGYTGDSINAPPGIFIATVTDQRGSVRVKFDTIRALPPPSFYEDADGDGYGNPASITEECEQPVGYVTNSDDCNDNNSSVHPDAVEICNNIDDDCDGLTDEGVQITFYRDEDGDGFGIPYTTIQACSAPPGYVSDTTDCNDALFIMHPGGIEICNGLDDNCNGVIDEGVTITFYRDFDDDGYGNINMTTENCYAPDGYVAKSTDCNDLNENINPGMTELCNDIDDNCDGVIDEGCTIALNVKAYIEGFYISSGQMRATVDPVSYPTLCDSVWVELMSATFPYIPLYTDSGTIDINGNVEFSFDYDIINTQYYVVMHHRSAIETWSSIPVDFNSLVVNYSFADAITKAYGSNMRDLGDGNFALWSGDISDVIQGVGVQDGIIESSDYSDMENAVTIVLIGYVTQDITGDGVVESYDYSILENNVYWVVFSMHP